MENVLNLAVEADQPPPPIGEPDDAAPMEEIAISDVLAATSTASELSLPSAPPLEDDKNAEHVPIEFPSVAPEPMAFAPVGLLPAITSPISNEMGISVPFQRSRIISTELRMSKENSRDCEVYLGVVNLVLKNYANFENDSVHKAFPRKTHKSMFDAILDVMGRSDSRSAISRFHYPRVI